MNSISNAFFLMAAITLSGNPADADEKVEISNWESGARTDPVTFDVDPLTKMLFIVKRHSTDEKLIDAVKSFDDPSPFEERRREVVVRSVADAPQHFLPSEELYIDLGNVKVFPVDYNFDEGYFVFCIPTPGEIGSGSVDQIEGSAIDVGFNLSYSNFNVVEIENDNEIPCRTEIDHGNKKAGSNFPILDLADFDGYGRQFWDGNRDHGYSWRGSYFGIPMDADIAEKFYEYEQQFGTLQTRLICRATGHSFDRKEYFQTDCAIDSLEILFYALQGMKFNAIEFDNNIKISVTPPHLGE